MKLNEIRLISELQTKDQAVIMEELKKNNINLSTVYQELEMNSPYVNTHRDISVEPERIQLHSHSFYEIIFCENGNIQYLIADKRYRIHTGDIILVPPGISHGPLFYDEMKEKIEIEFVKVKGHSNDKYNDLADELAKKALDIFN